MNKTKSLAAQVVGAAAIVTLIGTSAFAESRHSDATERDHSRQSDQRGSRDSNRQSREQRSNRGSDTRTFQRHDSGTTAPRTFDRGQFRGNQPQTFQRGETRNDSRNYQRNDSRNYGNYSRGNTQFDRRTQPDNFRNRGSFDRNRGSNDRSWGNYHSNRPTFDSRGRRDTFIHGRVSRFLHERGGYRIWIDGGLYPIWIPEARISLFPRLRVGLSLGFGGYYDPSGYLDAYDYYDGGGYAGIGTYGGGSTAYSSGLLRGTVESVDYRNSTLVLRDDTTGNFVTTLIRDRRLESLRPGDYAEISGDWTRSGVFEGLRLEDEQGGRY
jgi:hypothetical protein